MAARGCLIWMREKRRYIKLAEILDFELSDSPDSVGYTLWEYAKLRQPKEAVSLSFLCCFDYGIARRVAGKRKRYIVQIPSGDGWTTFDSSFDAKMMTAIGKDNRKQKVGRLEFELLSPITQLAIQNGINQRLKVNGVPQSRASVFWGKMKEFFNPYL